jgi:hypothetical protein
VDLILTAAAVVLLRSCPQEYLAALRAVDASAGLTDAATVEQLLKQGGEVVAEAGPSAAELGAAPALPDVSGALNAQVGGCCCYVGVMSQGWETTLVLGSWVDGLQVAGCSSMPGAICRYASCA